MSLTDLLNQSISLSTFNSITQYGDVSYNSAATYPARVERRIKVVRSMQGEEAVSTARIFLNGSVTLDIYGRDKITLSDGKTPPILAISDGVQGDGSVLYVEVSV